MIPSPLRGWRGRLLAAFVLVAVPPLLVLAAAVFTLVSERLDGNARGRLETGVRAVARRLDEQQRRAAAQVAAAAREDLPALPADPESARLVATVIAERRDLPLVEVVAADGRVLSSHHWPAAVGLPERDRPFSRRGAFRLETVGQGYGAAERLAVTASAPVEWAGRSVTLRGGTFVDGADLGELAELMGVDVALRDGVRDRWIAPEGSLLARWKDPDLRPDRRQGEADAEGTALWWAAAPVEPGLFAVVAVPRTLLAEVTGGLRRLTLGVALLAALLAFGAALVLSARIAGPVRALAAGADRVAAGDLAARVPVTGTDEVADLARAFNAMTEELQVSRERLVQAERVAAWREMARRLAHELKNPLFPIQLSIETLRRAADQPLPEAERGRRFDLLFRESSETILDEIRSLRKIIEEFSEFARMPRPQLAPSDVNAVVERALALYEPRAGAVRIERALAPGLPPASADPDLLARALGNLLANALDAMPEGGRLAVTTAADPEGVKIEVADTGPGLTEDQRTRLFTPYYTTKKGGTGLGLAIVQGIVSDHGGRILVASEPGRGTTFTLVLPAAPGGARIVGSSAA